MALETKNSELTNILILKNTSLYIDSDFKALGKGLLQVSQEFIIWNNDEDDSYFKIEYSNLSMHAISRDTSSFPYSCILCFVNSTNDPCDGEIDENLNEQMRFVLEDETLIEETYKTIADFQALHPDSDDSMSSDDDLQCSDDIMLNLGTQHSYALLDSTDDLPQGFFNTSEGFDRLNSQGLEVLKKLNGMLENDGVSTDFENYSEADILPNGVGMTRNSDYNNDRVPLELLVISEGQFDDIEESNNMQL